ncbi:MAG: primosomal protein N' [Epulopiscium sp. Nele67-Bin004]|nr:MAG: primosomal protein N' [Epulopiscium sp. Nele67-Bin004]
MTPKERKIIYMKAQSGEIQVVIGPRSAVFMPFQNLGLIVVDEEHDGSYKSENQHPKYNAIEVATKRMDIQGGKVILASATPSMETYYKAKISEIAHVKILSRAGDASKPNIELVDMRLELKGGNNQVISKQLHQAIEQVLTSGKQVMLLLNRRGHSTFISCRSCGFVINCGRCDLPMTYHQKGQKLICHHCLAQQGVPVLCPTCGSKHIRFFGNGTQKLEEYLNRYFSKFGIGRMDFDTTSSKEGHNNILEAFRSKQINVLVGTQMIAKGHDFSSVTLVGIISADNSLFMPDFRANERTYQLLTQTLGRAGRGKDAGTVIIQTYSPEHEVIQDVKFDRQHQFYERELEARELNGYPPYNYLFNVLISGNNENTVIQKANHLADYYKVYNRKKLFRIIGPVQATIGKIADEYRWKIMIVGTRREILLLFGRYCIDKFAEKECTNFIKIGWDIDPRNMI